MIGYNESGSSGQFLIYNNWNTTSTSPLDFSNNNLTGFSDEPTYKYFQNVPASWLYGNSTFTSNKYPPR